VLDHVLPVLTPNMISATESTLLSLELTQQFRRAQEEGDLREMVVLDGDPIVAKLHCLQDVKDVKRRTKGNPHRGWDVLKGTPGIPLSKGGA